ncbi:39S ribosomal protein L10, mitochondrial-like [Biomphalaria glabrata]|uniref:Large ribosomal subunit protein uL10m n=1 Tax=Biomphalaria glabrata TaxID=6526 RepID=A0A9W2Z3Q2_BIOGL|nr:39S ribosomal protein L10, mitochondrial-like [Biomphalaria glabrata]
MASNLKSVCRYFSTSSRLLKKPNIQKPRVPWTERRILNAVSTPILPPDERPLPIRCCDEMNAKIAARETELSQAYKAFRKKQIVKMFTENKMVAICHIVPMIPRDAFSVRAKIMAAQINLCFANKKFVREYLEESKYRNLEPYIASDTVYVVSPDNKVAQLLAVLRKTPELQLLGGLVEDTIMSKEMMINFSKMPPIEVLQGELLTILTSSIATTSHLLSTQQEQLSYNLSQLTQRGVEASVETNNDEHKDIEVKET